MNRRRLHENSPLSSLCRDILYQISKYGMCFAVQMYSSVEDVFDELLSNSTMWLRWINFRFAIQPRIDFIKQR